MRISENISKKTYYTDLGVSARTKSLDFTELLFLLYILILPLESSDYFNFSAEIINVNVSAADLLVIAIFYLVFIKNMASKSKVSFLPHKFILLFTLAIVTSTLSLFYIPWNEDIPYDLKMTLNLIEFLAIFYVTTALVRDMEILNKTLLAFCIGLLIYSVLTIFKSIGFDIPGYQRMSHLQIGPFYVGTIAIFNSVLPISLLILVTFPLVMSVNVIRSFWFRVPLILVYLMCALLAYTRSLWIALIFQIALFIYFGIHTNRNFVKKFVLAISLITIGILLFIFSNEIYLFMEGIRPSTFHSRLHGYRVMIDLVTSDIKFLLFGAGKGQFVQYYSWLSGEESVVHNFLLDILISKGIITLLLVLSIICMITYNLFEIKNTNYSNTGSYSILFILSIFGMIIEGMMNPITSSLIFWTYLALACSFILIVKRRIKFSRSYT